jgi:N12 class adenine-specific DNA methylase
VAEFSYDFLITVRGSWTSFVIQFGLLNYSTSRKRKRKETEHLIKKHTWPEVVRDKAEG